MGRRGTELANELLESTSSAKAPLEPTVTHPTRLVANHPYKSPLSFSLFWAHGTSSPRPLKSLYTIIYQSFFFPSLSLSLSLSLYVWNLTSSSSSLVGHNRTTAFTISSWQGRVARAVLFGIGMSTTTCVCWRMPPRRRTNRTLPRWWRDGGMRGTNTSSPPPVGKSTTPTSSETDTQSMETKRREENRERAVDVMWCCVGGQEAEMMMMMLARFWFFFFFNTKKQIVFFFIIAKSNWHKFCDTFLKNTFVFFFIIRKYCLWVVIRAHFILT